MSDEFGQTAAILGALAAVASAGVNIHQAATAKTPEEPKTPVNQAALQADRARRAAAVGSRGNVLTSQRLGQVGQ